MKDIKTKEVTTKPKTKNPASRIPKELMRTAILESKEKSQTIANARDNDMGEQSLSEYASGKVTSAEEWAARKTGRTVTSAGKTAAQTSYEKIKLRVTGKKEAQKEAARGTGDTQAPDPVSREAPKQKKREQGASRVKGQGTGKPGSPDSESQAAKGDFRCRQKRKNRRSGQLGRHQESRMDRKCRKVDRFPSKDKTRKARPKIPQGRMPSARNSRKASGSRKSHGNSWSRRPYSGVLLRPPLHL